MGEFEDLKIGFLFCSFERENPPRHPPFWSVYRWPPRPDDVKSIFVEPERTYLFSADPCWMPAYVDLRDPSVALEAAHARVCAHGFHRVMQLVTTGPDTTVASKGWGRYLCTFDRIGYLSLRTRTLVVASFLVWKVFSDGLGCLTGLVVCFLVWKLHTIVHRGLIQMWRYTKGTDTAAESLKGRVSSLFLSTCWPNRSPCSGML
jgi:hypothetical protein